MNQLEYGVRVELIKADDFLKIRETLTRIGIASFNPDKAGEKGKSLIQSCHILHETGKYYIVHFKELFRLDEISKDVPSRTLISEDDLARRNSIAFLLQEWRLLNIIEPKKYEDNREPLSKVKVIPFKEKDDWNLVSKHYLGRKKSY